MKIFLTIFTIFALAGCAQPGGDKNASLGSTLPFNTPTSGLLGKVAAIKVKDVEQVKSVATDVNKGLTMTDEEVVTRGQQGITQSDAQAKIAIKDKYAKRLEKLVAKHKNEDGLKLNFKVYLVNEVNAFASPDGSIRVYSGLMDKLTDDELSFVIGHEIGHVKLGHSLAAFKAEYLARAARSGLSSTKIGSSQLGSQLSGMAEEGVNAQFSQEHERQADDYGLAFNKKYKFKPAGAVSALEKLALLFGNESSMFASHPAPGDRAVRLKEQLAAQGIPSAEKPAAAKKKK